MQAGLIIRAFIASPGDVQPEREKAVSVVMDWNAANSLSREAIVEVIQNATHTQGEFGDHPQEIINRQLLDRCDFLIAVFWSKIGTATNKEKSGTIHEIRDFIRRKGAKHVLLLFSRRDFPHNADTKAIEQVREFKDEMKTEGVYFEYSDLPEFERILGRQLDLRMNELLKSDSAGQIWRRKAVLDEQTRILMESHRVAMGRIVGREIPPADNPTPLKLDSVSRRAEMAERIKRAAQVAVQRWDVYVDEKQADETAHSLSMIVKEILVDYEGVITSSLNSRLLAFVESLDNFCQSMNSPGRYDEWHRDGKAMVDGISDFAQML